MNSLQLRDQRLYREQQPQQQQHQDCSLDEPSHCLPLQSMEQQQNQLQLGYECSMMQQQQHQLLRPPQLQHQRKRRKNIFPGSYLYTLSFILLLTLPLVTLLPTSINAFGLRSITRRFGRNTKPTSNRGSSFNDGDDSWSKSAEGRRSSPLQVRRRVKAVLQRARSRTGVENKSIPSSSSSSSSPSPATESQQQATTTTTTLVTETPTLKTTAAASPPTTTTAKSPAAATIVANAASIGGLADDVRIEFKDKTTTATTTNNNKNIKKNGVQAPSSTTTSSNPTTLGELEPDVYKSNGETEPPKRNGVKKPIEFADERLEVTKISKDSRPNNINGNTNGNAKTAIQNKRKPKEFDVVRGDIPAANEFCEPRPFALPQLSNEQKERLKLGERVQEQARMGREGSGYVVLDVKAPPYVVWECLLDFESYPQTIPTVRDMQLYTSEKLNTGYVNEQPVLPGTGRATRHYGTPSITRAKFILSKFRLNIAAVHTYTPHPDGDYMIFTLDKSCTNMVLKGAKGIWYTEENPDGREGYTRVYLLCEVQVSRALPSFIVDYTADRAMPRATNWLKPQVEAAADLWLKTPRSR